MPTLFLSLILSASVFLLFLFASVSCIVFFLVLMPSSVICHRTIDVYMCLAWKFPALGDLLNSAGASLYAMTKLPPSFESNFYFFFARFFFQ